MILSLVIDPRLPGGVATVNHWYDRWMTAHGRERIEVYLDERAGPFDFARRGAGWQIGNGGIPRLLPHLHVPPYHAGRRLLSRCEINASEIHAVGGHVLHGSLAARRPEPSLAWVGTTIGDERRSVLAHHRWYRGLSYGLSIRSLERLEREVLLRAEKLLAQSRHTADLMIAVGVDARRVDVLAPPVDTSDFTSEGAAERNGLIFVGRAGDPRKNFPAVLRLMDRSQLARERGVDVVSDQAVRLGRDTALKDVIRWHGRVDDLPGRYRAAELLVLPSIQEGFGAVVFEALACETPVVAFRCGGPDHFLAASGGGYVVDDEPEFKLRVEELLRDGSARKEMGQAGRRWVEKNMSAKDFLEDPSLFSVRPN